MRQVGKQGLKWQQTRRKWIKENPPNFQGYWVCYLCGKWIDKYEMTLDHIIPRSGDATLIHDFSNLQPACYPCNSEKGSKRLDK